MGFGGLAFLMLFSRARAAPDTDPERPPEDIAGQPAGPPEQEAAEAPPIIPPKLLEGPPLEPVAAVPEGGAVTLLLLIDEQGAVETVSYVSGPTALFSTAMSLALELRFQPALEGERPVAVEMEWTLVFPAQPPPVEADPIAPPPLNDDDEGLVASFYRPGGAPVIHQLSRQEIAILPGTMGDPVRAVANMPGVVRTPLEAGWLLVRGGGPTDTGLFVDGVRVPLIYHLGGLTSAVHPAFVADLDFMPSGQPPRYGGATSGVLDLHTGDAGPATRAEARVDLIASGAYVSDRLGPKDQLGLQLAVRRSYLDAILALVPGITETQASIAPRFWDWGVRADLGENALFLFGYDDSIDVPNDNTGATVTVTQGTRRAQLRGEAKLGERTLAWSAFSAREWALIDADELKDERLARRGGGRLELPDPGRGAMGWSAGLEADLGTWEMAVNEVNVGGPTQSLSPYGTLRLGSQRVLTASMRLETLKLADQLLRVAPTASLGATVPISGAWTATADLGLYRGVPPLDVTYGLPGGAYLPLTRSRGGGLGVQRRGEALDLELDLWGRAMDHIAVLEDDSSLGQAHGLAGGLEALATVERGPLSSRTCLTLSRSLRQNEPGHPWEPYTFDQPVLLQTVLARALSETWTLAARFRYGSGFPRDPEIEEAYDILRSDALSLEEWPERLPAFHALDLKISRQISTRRWAIEGYLDVQNVYNHRGPEPAITGVTWQPIFYTYGLPILPIFGVQGSFRGS